MSDEEDKTVPIAPSELPIAAATASSRAATATIVDSSTGSRARVPVLDFDERFVTVEVVGEPRRFSRWTGFEIPVGGSWSVWRLAGKDLRAWKPKRS